MVNAIKNAIELLSERNGIITRYGQVAANLLCRLPCLLRRASTSAVRRLPGYRY